MHCCYVCFTFNIILKLVDLIKRSGDWWDHIFMETFTSQEWLEYFRLSKDTFDYFCTELSICQEMCCYNPVDFGIICRV